MAVRAQGQSGVVGEDHDSEIILGYGVSEAPARGFTYSRDNHNRRNQEPAGVNRAKYGGRDKELRMVSCYSRSKR